MHHPPNPHHLIEIPEPNQAIVLAVVFLCWVAWSVWEAKKEHKKERTDD